MAQREDGLTQAERDILLEIHNKARAEVNVPPLVWDDALARIAAEYAKRCDYPLCHWSQSGALRPCFRYDARWPDAPLGAETKRLVGRHPATDGCMPMGENLYIGTGCPAARAAAQFWYDEMACTVCGAAATKQDCVPMRNQTQKTCAFKPCGMCGHYTQMVWQTTRKIGCAKHKCPNGDYVVCEYFPGGNVEGLLPFDCSVCESLRSRFHNVVPCRNDIPVGEERPSLDLAKKVKETNVARLFPATRGPVSPLAVPK